MRIGVSDMLLRHARRDMRVPSCRDFFSTFGLRPIGYFTYFERLMSTDRGGYDDRRSCSVEMGVPNLNYETCVMSFGDGSSGALGIQTGGYSSDVFTPETIQGLPTNIVKVATGHYHSLAVTEGGEVWAWGRNSEGQLGPRDDMSREGWSKPQKVKGLENVQVKDVAGSGVVSMALARDGSLWSWGSSKRGQLGLGLHVNQSEAPRKVEALASQQVSQMALGWGHVLACTNDGELYSWGHAADGRLGFHLQSEKEGISRQREPAEKARSLTRSELAEVVDLQVQAMLQNERLFVSAWEPHCVEDLKGQRVMNVACGMDHSLALAENGVLFSFGDNSLGQLGRTLGKTLVGAVEFPGEKNKVVSFAAGLGHSLAVALDPSDGGSSIAASPHQLLRSTRRLTTWEEDTQEAVRGSLFSWGWNSGSQLGRGGNPNLPRLVDGLTEERLVQVAAGRVHSAGLSSLRQVLIWGSGRLGLGSSKGEPYPSLIEDLSSWKVLQVACGFDHSLLLVRTVAHSPCKGSVK